MDTLIEPINILLIAAAFVLVAIGVLKLLSTPPRKSAAEAARECERRLRNPDFAGLEERFGVPLPSALKRLYEDPSETARENLTVAPSADAPPDQRHFISHFEPCDADSLTQDPKTSREYLVFASDGGETLYVVDPVSADPPVLQLDLENGRMRIVCNSLSTFLEWPRLDTTD